MDRKARIKLLEEIEKKRNSKLLVCFFGDRPFATSQLSDDVVRPIYDHLLALTESNKKLNKIDLFLYGRGGRLEVPWRIITMVREFCNNLDILIPYKAYSAITLAALGGDNLIMGRKGELGPIDPSLHVVTPEGAPRPELPSEIGVEDISSYIAFIKEKAGLTDQAALSQATSILANKLSPPLLGQIYRAHAHIRLVARKLLSLSQPPLSESKIEEIVAALAEKIYLHGHGIGRKEAEEIGLTIKKPEDEVEKLIWDLYLLYENLLKLDQSRDPFGYFPDNDKDKFEENDIIIACIESTNKLHIFQGDLIINRLRKVPSKPVINVNISLQLPQGVQPGQLPPQIQQTIQQVLKEGAFEIEKQVVKEITRQSPIKGFDARIVKGRWQEVKQINLKSI